MPNSLNAEKRHRQSLTARARNRAAHSQIRTRVKKFDAAVRTGQAEAAREFYREFVKAIDSAAGKKLCHRNAAARKKSRLYRKIAALEKGAIT